MNLCGIREKLMNNRTKKFKEKKKGVLKKKLELVTALFADVLFRIHRNMPHV